MTDMEKMLAEFAAKGGTVKKVKSMTEKQAAEKRKNDNLADTLQQRAEMRGDPCRTAR